ncbi:MAG: aminodeoxychorismate/anthranilate synthase component II [Alphaproteobacteria bacterium]|nr:aminodeoxychorismate/anthranilate synthase component II [Alphaproteobacteria bacterium]
MIILIDNYDSFTWNLWHFLSDLGAEVTTIRNDIYSVSEIIEMKPSGIVLSPGPGRPEQAGICENLIKQAAPKIPILGVCLGHQAIATAFGGSVSLLSPPVHGKLSLIEHQNTGVFEGLSQSFPVTRYHSLVVNRQDLPKELEVIAQTNEGIIMGMQHKNYPCVGVQFHPESIASVGGYRILAHFLATTGKNSITETMLQNLEQQTLRLDIRFPEQIHV